MTEAEEPLSNISDSSFIILGQGSLPPSLNNETDAEFSNKNEFALIELNRSKRNTPSRSSEVQSFMEDDIQGKLNELVRENYQLKETLSQNNLAIKSQLDTFYMWQQEVLKTHETHKQKFLETKDLILKLRAENLNLKKQLDDYFCILSNDDAYAEVNKNKDCDTVKDETEKFQKMCKDLTSKTEILEGENTKLREKLKETESEVLKLNKELEDVLRENKFLKQKTDEQKSSAGCLSYSSLPNSEARAQIYNLFKQLEMERSRVTKLKKQLTVYNGILSKAEHVSLAQEVDECMKNIDGMDQNQRLNSLQSWVTLAEEKIKDGTDDNLFSEKKELKCHISQEEKTSKQKQENLQELKDQFSRLLEDHKTLQQQLDAIKNAEADTEKYKEEISNLSRQLNTKSMELLSKQQECDRLKEEVKKLNLECEEVAILRIQMELYQKDFNEERSDREKLAEEKEKMAEELRLLQSRPKALEKDKTKEEDEKQQENAEESNLGGPFEGKEEKYLCTKCMFSFSVLERYESHVSDCANDHFNPFQ